MALSSTRYELSRVDKLLRNEVQFLGDDFSTSEKIYQKLVSVNRLVESVTRNWCYLSQKFVNNRWTSTVIYQQQIINSKRHHQGVKLNQKQKHI